MKYIFPSVAILMLIPLMMFSKEVTVALPEILSSVASVVLGVLFPSSVLLRTFCFSPVSALLSGIVSKTVFWRRTGMPHSLAPAVICGQLSGFPMTACLIEKGEGGDMALALGSVASPVFFASVFGVKNGLWLWGIQIGLLYFYAMAFGNKGTTESKSTFSYRGFSDALSSATSSAVGICGAMLFFSVILTLVPSGAREWVAPLLEIGTASRLCASPVSLAIAFSLGGLSILAQISFCADGVSLKHYIKSRFLILLPTMVFLAYPKMKLFVTIHILLLLMWQITRRNTCKNGKCVV
ncbi:MAG: hypothetical protein IKV53_03290 [Clostridia bacterium]|nr:hypothetical protein [Clostridia bacterium]